MSDQYITNGETVYFHVGVNDTSGSGNDGASALVDVRECGATGAAPPIASGTSAMLLSHANYPAGAYEVAVDTTTGYSADKTYAVFFSITADSQNPTGFVGRFHTTPVKSNPQTGSIVTVTGNVGGTVASVSGSVASVTGNIGGNVAGTVSAVSGSVASVTGNIGGNIAGTVSAVSGSVASVVGNVGGNIAGSVASVSGSVASVVGAVTLANSAHGGAAASITLADYTDFQGAGAGGVALTDTVEGAITLQELLRFLLARACGPASGGGSDRIVFEAPTGGTARITMRVDRNGNRSNITLNGS